MHEAFISYDGADNASYRLGYFINTISDAIVINSLFSQVENISRARIDGFELTGIQPIGKGWSTRANLTIQDPRNQQLNTILPRRSRIFDDGLEIRRGKLFSRGNSAG